MCKPGRQTEFNHRMFRIRKGLQNNFQVSDLDSYVDVGPFNQGRESKEEEKTWERRCGPFWSCSFEVL